MAPIGQSLESSEISSEEKAPFQLREMINELEQDVNRRSLRIQEMNRQIKQLMRSNERPAATRLLQQRKSLEKFVYSQYDRKYHLDEALLRIEQGQQNQMVFESLKIANEAGKQLIDGQSGLGESL